jgi:chemotaxis family two-component system sensor kinase Cph1
VRIDSVNHILNQSQSCTICRKGTASNVTEHMSIGNQVIEYFTKLFQTGDWPPRWHCGRWTDFHGWLYIVSDLMIAAAYFAIPFLLFKILVNRRDFPFPSLIWLFITFIILCGTTHLIDAVLFWWPAYRVSGLLRFTTGVVSIFTVVILYKISPLILSLRTQEQLETEIEARKKAEQEMRQQQLIRESTEELMRKKDEFISIASHELRTPITSIKASLQIIQRAVSKNEGLEPFRPIVDKSANQVTKLTNLVNELLDVTKIQAGRLELVKSSFVLYDLIQESVEGSLIDHRDYIVSIDGDKTLVVFADRNRIEQVLNNLLSNAIKYSPKNYLITVSFEKLSGGQTKVSVTDCGIGIDQSKVVDVFERFFRVEHSIKNYAGLGLGLYISANIVKQHLGEIGVDSELGSGSTFWFII